LWFQIRQPHLEALRKLPHPGEHGRNMNRILIGLISIAFFFQSAVADTPEKTDLTPIQAGRISAAVGQILQQLHYRQVPFDDQVSAMFLTNYLNTLDYNHMVFLQSDVDEFMARYATRLDDATKQADASPATRIFDRYLERLSERNILVQKLLKQDFDFTTDESFLLSRNKEPWPKDDAEAAKLWRKRIKYELLQARLAKEKPEETIGLISRRYNRLEKMMSELEREEILQMYLNSLAHSYDPHSDYMTPSEAQNFDIEHISLSLTGIGAQLIWVDGYTKIKELLPGGPAAASKQLHSSDKIVAVAQGKATPVDVVEMPLNKVVGMIRGKKGSEVRLTIIPAKAPDTKKIVTLIRNEIQFKKAYAKARVYETTDENGKVQKIGVINLPQFYDNCASHVEMLIQRLKKENVQGLVLDLRHNGGGILDEAVQLTGLFIKKGPVVQVKEPEHKPHVLEDRDSDVAWDGPLVVAVGKLSASASEIVAAALQDYGRAVVVGDQSTHGKGTVQQVLSLNAIPYLDKRFVANPGKLKITVQKFYRINGSTTQKQGVTPDVILPSIYDYLDIGEASLENCLPADQTTPADDYVPLGRVKPFVAELQKLSHDRISTNKDFAYLMEDIEQVKKRQEEKTVSMNEKVRLAENERDKARAEARKKERAGRVASTRHIFELDLDMVKKTSR
jgi:carboxyl-terminal processing protease